jgi:hypothetical protein
MAVILPVIAILSVTAEWTQRSGLTTHKLLSTTIGSRVLR